MKKLALIVSAIALLVSGAIGNAQDVKDPVTELHKKGFNVLVTALSATDLPAKLQSGSFTLFAPTDVAFRDLPKAELDALLADKEKLTTLLSKHIVEGKVTAADLKSGDFKTIGGTTIKARSVDGKLKLGTATVVRADLPTSTGLIHGIDKMLQP